MADMNNLHTPASQFPHHHQPVVNHTRPFFYVQPPSQPLCTYQWNNMNPYGQYGLTTAALPYMRHVMVPYPYTSACPGYVVPQAPLYPVDYRQMFSQLSSSAGAQNCATRETASSEVQTDPVVKPTGGLDSLNDETPERSATPTGLVMMKMESRSSADPGERSEAEPLAQERSPATTRGDVGRCLRTSPWPTPVDSPAEGANSSLLACVDESSWASSRTCSGSSQDNVSRGETQSLISGIDVLPIDSSSVNGEDDAGQRSSGAPCWDSESPTGGAVHLKVPASPSGDAGKAGNASVDQDAADQELLQCADPHTEYVEKHSHAGSLEQVKVQVNPAAEDELPYRILRLPCDKVTTALLQQNHPLWFVDSSSSTPLPPLSYLSSGGGSCCPHPTIQVATERRGVLSASVDELSSSSADDLAVSIDYSNPVLLGGGKMAVEGLAPRPHSPLTCVCCGDSIGQSPGLWGYGREDADVDQRGAPEYEEEERCLPQQQYYSITRQRLYSCPPLLQPAADYLHHRRRSRKPCDCEDCYRVETGCHDEELGNDCGPDYRSPAPIRGGAYEHRGKGQRNGAPRSHYDKPWLERSVEAASDSCGGCGSNFKPRFRRNIVVEPDHLQHKRPSKAFMQQRPRRCDLNCRENEDSDYHRGRGNRGSTKRRGTKY